MAAATAVGACAVGAAPAAAAPTTWEGRCTILGESVFERPFGAIPEAHSYRDRGRGTCTGTLNGEDMSDAPIRLAADGMGSVGCLATQTVMFGTLRFTQGTRGRRDDVLVHYAGEATGAVGQGISRTRGRDGGHGIAYVSVLGSSDPEMAQRCRENAVERVRWETTTQTITPSEG